jgi:molecular chaperone DnaJ
MTTTTTTNNNNKATEKEEEERSRTHYEVLGVTVRSSEREIKKAYRQLALRLHPDKFRYDAEANNTKTKEERLKEVEQKFAEVTVAFDTLSDALKRVQYDREKNLNGSKSSDILINVTFKEALNGCTKLAMVPFKTVCDKCAGSGKEGELCTKCTILTRKSCSFCKGLGVLSSNVTVNDACRKCKGQGCVDDFFQSKVVIPKNPKQNERVKIEGRDTCAIIYTMPSKQFQKVNAFDVKTVLKLTHEQAKEGGFFEVETLYGKETIYIEDGTEDGMEKIIENQGIEKKGNQIVVIDVQQREHSIDDDNDDNDDDANIDNERKRKASTEVNEVNEEQDELKVLLAEKKRKLLEKLSQTST